MIARYCLKSGRQAEIENVSLKSVINIILVDAEKVLPSTHSILE
jgi:hypothetical protein